MLYPRRHHLGRERDMTNIFAVVCGDKTRGNNPKLVCRKFCTNIWSNFFMVRVTALEQAAKGGCGFSSGDDQDPPDTYLWSLLQGACITMGWTQWSLEVPSRLYSSVILKCCATYCHWSIFLCPSHLIHWVL